MDNQGNKPRRRRRKYKKIAIVRRNRTVMIGIFLILCVFGLIFRMWYLQNNYGEEYKQFSAAQRAIREMERTSEVFIPMRGGFVDRHMQPITGTEQVFTVFLDVEALHERNRIAQRNSSSTDVREEVFNAIMLALNVPRWELLEMFHTDDYGNLLMTAGRNRRVLRHEVPAEIAIPLTEAYAEVHRDETSSRWYLDAFFAPQVIGFQRGDSMWGLEAYYNEQLTGEQGRNIRVQGETESIPVRDGYTIVTTLDGEIQRLAQFYTDRTYVQYPSRFVGMIVMEPYTGEVLAMSQAPTFSLNEPFNPEFFTDPHLAELWPLLDDNERTSEVMSLWRNYHITGGTEPGSVFKPFVIAAAIEEGKINDNSQFVCNGVRRFEAEEMSVTCHSTCGVLSLRRAITSSCNMAMISINNELGKNLFYQYRGYFGFGEYTGIDLPGETDVSSPTVMYTLGMLNPVEMATSSIGQGFNTTTMQMITGYTALINGGNLMRPYLVSQIVDSFGNIVHETTPEIVRRVISPDTSEYIRNELRFVVSQNHGVSEGAGTGHRANIPGYSIGGKTGTAQQGARDAGDHNLTFVAFMPVNNPQYLVLMTIDHIEDSTRFGGDTVAPIVREFLLDLIKLKNIRPYDEEDYEAPEIFGALMPDYSGMRLVDAVQNNINLGISSYQVVGGGTMVSHHMPAAGFPLPETSAVIFYTDPDTRISERMITVPSVVDLRSDEAERLLEGFGLGVAIFYEENLNPTPSDVTAGAEPLDDNPIAPPVFTVFQQFPSPGAEVEQSTKIILRVR